MESSSVDYIRLCGQIYTDTRQRDADIPALRGQVAELYQRVQPLEGHFQEKRLLAQSIVQLASSSTTQPPPFANGELEKRFGTISQYSDTPDEIDEPARVSNACTSCAQCFLTRALKWDGVIDIQSREINQIVSDGKDNYELMRERAWQTHKGDSSLPYNEAFSHFDTKDIYGLEHVNCERGQVLKRDDEPSTQAFFSGELIKLEQLAIEHGSLGGILHSQGKTYALATFNCGNHFEYALFDSHGCERENTTKAAFVWITKDKEQMAEALASLIPYIATELEDIPRQQREDMEAEDNGTILYVVKAGDNGTIRRRVREPLITSPSNGRNNVTENTHYLALSLLLAIAAAIIAYRNRLISMITSYTGNMGQTYLLTPPPSIIK